MKRVLLLFLTVTTAFAEPAKPEAPVNTVCPITGKVTDPTIISIYEGTKYAFADEAAREKFEADRTASLYQELGGKAAIDAAVELFYKKVLADDRVKHFFAEINMTRQRKKQKEFLSMALGAPTRYTGADLRTAHADLALNDSHFNAIAELLKATLVELKVKESVIERSMAIVETTRNDVLNRKSAPK